MKRLDFFFLLVSIVMASFTLTSCGDDDNEDVNNAKNAIAQGYVGTYSGTDNLNVGMAAVSWNYSTANSVSYRITANNDGTINVTMPEETYTDTQIGNITIGSYTIDSLKYVVAGYTRAYKGSKAKVHFSSTGSDKYPIVLNDNYSFSSDACVITVNRTSDGTIQINNAYVLGKSPVLIKHTFTGTK